MRDPINVAESLQPLGCLFTITSPSENNPKKNKKPKKTQKTPKKSKKPKKTRNPENAFFVIPTDEQVGS